MFPAAALLLFQTIAALLLPVSPFCENEVSCPCGSTGRNYTFCNIHNMTTEEMCQTWSKCLQCADEVDHCLKCPVGMVGRTCSRNEMSICQDPGFLPSGTRKRNDGSSANRSEEFREGEVLIFSCRRGFALEGSSIIICRKDGKWSDILPRCRRSVDDRDASAGSCPDPGTLINGDRFNTDGEYLVRERTYRPGQSIVFSCHSGFALHGTSMITCQRLGSWSRGKPFCSRFANSRNRTISITTAAYVKEDLMYCKRPGPIFNGEIDVVPSLDEEKKHSTNDDTGTYDDDEYPQGTSLNYTCEEGYLLRGNAVITCEDTGFWSAKPPTCVAVCGRLSAKVPHSEMRRSHAETEKWPWMVGVFVLSPYSSRMECGGVLVNSRTVLTAASCFTGGHQTYQLLFGKYKYRTKDDDDKVLQRTNMTVKIHPGYNNRTFYPDIALVQFSPSIPFSDRIEPICLPTPQTTAKNIVDRRKGYVISWGGNRDLKWYDSLLTSHLTVISGDFCLRKFPNYLGNMRRPNLFCVDRSEGPNVICWGDGGSPMVFYDNVKKRFILEGLISIGIPATCGRPGDYTALTEVLPYVPWIMQNMT